MQGRATVGGCSSSVSAMRSSELTPPRSRAEVAREGSEIMHYSGPKRRGQGCRIESEKWRDYTDDAKLCPDRN